jgi:hypothetical protein
VVAEPRGRASGEWPASSAWSPRWSSDCSWWRSSWLCDNAIVEALLDAGAWLAEPFDNIFSMDSRKERIAVNYGLAALIYAIAGALIARLLRR